MGGRTGFAGVARVSVVAEAGTGSAVAVAVFFAAAIVFLVGEWSYHHRARLTWEKGLGL